MTRGTDLLGSNETNTVDADIDSTIIPLAEKGIQSRSRKARLPPPWRILPAYLDLETVAARQAFARQVFGRVNVDSYELPTILLASMHLKSLSKVRKMLNMCPQCPADRILDRGRR